MNAPPLAAGLRAAFCVALLAALPLVAHGQNPAARPAPPDSGRSRPEHPMGREGRPMEREGRPMGREGMAMGMMEDARLDSLVAAMHRATGTRKTAAMERVIDALLADRKAMHEHMMQMMQTMRARMGEGERNCMPGGSGCARQDSADHDQHH